MCKYSKHSIKIDQINIITIIRCDRANTESEFSMQKFYSLINVNVLVQCTA